jgi:hypothetical protein
VKRGSWTGIIYIEKNRKNKSYVLDKLKEIPQVKYSGVV